MTLYAGAIEDHLRSLAGSWEYPPDTVDTFKSGGRDTEVTGIAVAWLPFTWALEKAIELGCSLFVTHEPTFYDHHDSRAELFELEVPQERRHLLEESGIAVLRCHDLWDRHPLGGITDAWAGSLGLTSLVASSDYSRMYEIEPMSARSFATHVARSTAAQGQPGVHLIGDGERQVEKVCIGTGAISPYLDLVRDFDPDLVICSDDGLDYWRDGAFATDGGPPIVVVHHGVTEEPGMAKLAEHLAGAFPQIPVHHIPQSAMYELVTAPDGDVDANSAQIDGRSGDTKEGKER